MVVKILLVEGRHDAAFIGRILKANGYEDSKLTIGEYPEFIKGYLTKFFEGAHIEDSTIKNVVSNLFLPSSSLSVSSDPNQMLIIFPMGGDAQKDRRRELIRKLYKIFSNPMFQDGRDSLKIIYNLDADEHGIAFREQQVNEELHEIIDSSIPEIHNSSWTPFGGIQWGLYVFTDPFTGKGKLENLVLPLIEDNKKDLKSLVDSFISERPKMNYWNTKYKQYDEEKSRISMMCQMEISGVANTTLLVKTGLIDDRKLQTGIYKAIVDYITS